MGQQSRPDHSETIELSPEFLAGSTEGGLEKIRTRLLDLTNRNRLLNFRHTTSSSLRVVNVDLNSVFRRLLDGDKLGFLPVPEPEMSFSEEQSEDGGTPQNPISKIDAADYARILGWQTSYDLDEHSGSEEISEALPVLYYLDGLQTLTRKIGSAAKTAIEESGTNMLYLIFGFLEWYEADDSQQSRYAPLLTVPVAVERGTGKNKGFECTIEYSGEDFATNLSLLEKMRRDFALEIPNVEDEDTPDKYFALFTPILKQRKRWRVRPQITLSLLSFGKLLMYRDLDPKAWPGIARHVLVKELFEGKKQETITHADEYSIDSPELKRELPPLILDADSSQHSALIDAMRGKNLVIEGPPGTGKSQTITNLIAAALANGKTVLFVSEKLAALEVVRRRLDRAGLGLFCLELHSHKTKKDALLNDLALRLKARGSFRDPRDLDQHVAVVEEKKRVLTEYVTLINKPIEPLQESAFEILWARDRLFSELSGPRKLVGSVPNARSFTRTQYMEKEQFLAVYAQHLIAVLGLSSEVEDHPWAWVKKTLTFEQEERLIELLESFLEALRKSEQVCRALNEGTSISLEWCWHALWSRASVDVIGKALELLVELPAPGELLNCDLLVSCRDARNRDTLQAFALEVETCSARLGQLDELVSHPEELLRSEVTNQLAVASETLRALGVERYSSAKLRELFDNGKAAEAALRKAEQSFDALRDTPLVPGSAGLFLSCITLSEHASFEMAHLRQFTLDVETCSARLRELNELVSRPEEILRSEVASQLAVASETLRALGGEKYTSSQLREQFDNGKAAEAALREAEQSFDALQKFLGCELPFGTGSAGLLLNCLSLIERAPIEVLHLRLPSLEAEGVRQIIESASVEAGALLETRERLAGTFNLRVARAMASSSQLESCAKALEESSVLRRWFGRAYRQAIKGYRQICVTRQRVSRSKMAADFRALSDFFARQSVFDDNPQYRDLIGPHFKGVDTKWVQFELLVGWYEEIFTHLSTHDRNSEPLRDLLLKVRPERLKGLRGNLGHHASSRAAVDQFHTTIRQILASFPTLNPLADSAQELLKEIARTNTQLGHINDLLSLIGLPLNAPVTAIPQLVIAAEQYRTNLAQVVDTAQELLKELGRTNTQLGHINDLLSLIGLPLDAPATAIPQLVIAAEQYRTNLAQVYGNEAAQELLGSAFKGPETDIGAIKETLTLCNFVATAKLPRPFGEWILCEQYVSHREQLRIWLVQAIRCKDTLAELATEISTLSDSPVWLGNEAEPLDSLQQKAERSLDSRDALVQWVHFVRVCLESREAGLAKLTALADSKAMEPDHLVPAFRFLFYDSLARSVFAEHPELSQFTGITQEQVRNQFAKSDKKAIELHRERVASAIDRRPVSYGNQSGTVGTWSDLALITHEINKQKRHIPIRQLIRRAGNALQQLKPCFMMGPLSVAQYLAPGELQFDLIVMDEASQLKPEDAIGAIARGGQVVIVGDPKQLPPTNFFQRVSMDVDEDGDEASRTLAEEGESILDVASTLYQPVRRLRWHYRSRHHSLIAFSNNEFYQGDLVIFPSAYHEHASLGVRYHPVFNGIFENRRNAREAAAVVNAVLDHMEKRPTESLGVVTLNFEQRELIEEMLDQRLRTDPFAIAYQERMDGGPEPFFIKNLENVQGDERDVIFISCTYGPDSRGNQYQRFGPINGTNGHRRLNVLFTRAKKRVEVFSSLDPDKIDIGPSSAWGLRALKAYLQFAKTGLLDLADTGTEEPANDFERSVGSVLKSKGYQVVPQVGVAGFFIDLAVKHPSKPGVYMLGIECDGMSYHSGRSARDRDRLRQEILENLGWQIYRIWSTDWFKSRDKEIERLLQKVRGIIDQDPDVRKEREKTSQIQGLRDRLVEFRDRVVKKAFPDSDLQKGLLRDELLAEFIKHRPANKESWFKRIPVGLRTGTEGKQVAQFLDSVLEIISNYN